MIHVCPGNAQAGANFELKFTFRFAFGTPPGLSEDAHKPSLPNPGGDFLTLLSPPLIIA